MIVMCGKRRLTSDRFGWAIQIEHLNKKTGQLEWQEDRPAYPATLAQGLQMVLQRVLTDGPDLTITELSDALRRAFEEVQRYVTEAGAFANVLKEKK